MKTELSNLLLTEKYRPVKLEELILDQKESLLNSLKSGKTIPSYIFYSNRPGTGKSSCAKAIANYLDCDMLYLNSSMDRGIDTVRDKIRLYAQSMSSKEGVKRLVFLDEADGLTPQSLNSLRNLMEEYSENCFFIFTCNDLNKIIEPIRSRCILINFERPSKKEILGRLEYICHHEKIETDVEDLVKLIDKCYPDIRAMILTLQSSLLDKKTLLIDYTDYKDTLHAIKNKDTLTIYAKVFGSDFNILAFNRWFFTHLMENANEYGFEKTSKIALSLAEIEKYWNLGANLPIIFIAEMLRIAELLK